MTPVRKILKAGGGWCGTRGTGGRANVYPSLCQHLTATLNYSGLTGTVTCHWLTGLPAQNRAPPWAAKQITYTIFYTQFLTLHFTARSPQRNQNIFVLELTRYLVAEWPSGIC